MNLLKHSFALICVIFLFVSCGDDTILPVSEVDRGLEYHPIGVGKFWTYQVDSLVIINAGTSTRESTNYIRESLKSSFLNPNGDTTYVLERAVGSSPLGPFSATDLWKLERTDDRLVRIEENLEFVKILFPIKEGTNWQGNQFDEQIESTVSQQKMRIFKGWEYEVISDNEQAVIDGITYDSVLNIQQAKLSTFVELRESNEYYAPNVGLIRREMQIFDTQNHRPNEPWENFASRGFRMTQTLVDHN